ILETDHSIQEKDLYPPSFYEKRSNIGSYSSVSSSDDSDSFDKRTLSEELTEIKLEPLKISTDRRNSTDNASISSTKSIFALWSPFRSNTAPASTGRPSAQFAARQSINRPISIISPLPGFQEALLAQMEQLNIANTNNPKSKVIKNLKRQSIRHHLVAQNKGNDYDWDFWASIMCDPQHLAKVNKDLIKHIRFGIPPSIRGMVWQLLAHSKDEALVARYIELLKLVSPYDKMIQRDLARTFPGHTYFKESDGQGQEGLYNVVRAYSSYDHEVGYCQGLAFIVGPLLLNMPEEDAFCALIQLMNKYGLRGHFTPDMDGLQLRLYQFDALLQEYLPHVARHLVQQGINSTMYASQWFMTLFAYKFPLNLVFRIYDVILAEGISTIFKFAIALLKRNQTTLLGLDFEHVLDFLKNGLFEEYKDDDRRFVSDACELEIPARRLSQLEKEHKLQIQKEQADASLMDELQKSNASLKKKLKTLEAKAATLRSEHKDVCEQLQETQHQLSQLQDENSSIKQLVCSLQVEVDSLPQTIEAKTKEPFEALCSQNGSLIETNSSLEDQLQKAEVKTNEKN
ncbi:GTPase-activating protein, partial [Rhizopus stolonifer]